MRFWIDPWKMSSSATTSDSGSSTYRHVRTMSCQKLPSDLPLRPEMPRISATATVMPTPADTKFCTVSPTIWLK